MKGETGRGAGGLGFRQSRLRHGQDLPVAIEPNHVTVRTDGRRDACRVTTCPNGPVDDHESGAEIEDRQRLLEQHRHVHGVPFSARFAAATLRVRIQCAASLDHPTAVAECAP